jgi:DNA invertase Pin-like site-specific DNA recombinase
MAGRVAVRVGYIRVSTLEQNTVRQLDGIEVGKTFTDKASGKDTARPQLEELIAYVRDGDTVRVHSMDRLARNLDDLRRIVRTLTGKGVRVEFVKENLTFTGEDSPMANLLSSVMGAFAEFERALILERQRAAKARGVYKGRKHALTPEQAHQLRQRAAAGEKKSARKPPWPGSSASAAKPSTATSGRCRTFPPIGDRNPASPPTTSSCATPHPSAPPASDPAPEATPAPAEPPAPPAASPAVKAPRRRSRTSWEQRMRSADVESVRELVDISRPDESGVRRVTDHDGTHLGRVARETRLGGGRGRWIGWYDTGTRLPGRGWDTLEKAVVGLLLAIDDRAAMSAERAKRDRRARAGDKL